MSSPSSQLPEPGEELVLPRLVVGLGNPGGKYAATRHNVGFMILDRLVKGAGEAWSTEKRWECQVVRRDGVTYIKPSTYMNLSGRAVAAVSRFLKVSAEEVLVVHDDVDLSLGRLRLRVRGSAGGHNGIKSILAELGTDSFSRLKVGIGRVEERGGEMEDHVLGVFSAGEQEILEKTLQESVRAVECALHRGLLAAMNEFNRKEETQKATKKKRTEKQPEDPPEGGAA